MTLTTSGSLRCTFTTDIPSNLATTLPQMALVWWSWRG